MSSVILSIDAGTTGIRVVAFGKDGEARHQAYSEFTQHFPKPGWVEHDACEIWAVTLQLLEDVVRSIGVNQVVGIGITNQRETTVLWDKSTGDPLHHAIVWQCRRTTGQCQKMTESGLAETFKERTGLVLDAYFSGTKLQWLLDNVPDARDKAEAGTALFGTIDSWLLWKLTGGSVHATDPTNASRTLLFNIHDHTWDADLLHHLTVPPACLPDVKPSSGLFGDTHPASAAGLSVPVAGIAGDQQAALFGQGCIHKGQIKNTYGTGCFALVNCGKERLSSENGLLVTIACGPAGEPVYALEGSVFVGGAAVQWLRDGLKIIDSAPDIEPLAHQVTDSERVIFIPALAGLGAPYWDPEARGAILGLTRGTTRAHIARATLEGIAFQSRDLIDAFEADLGEPVGDLCVDGGATTNDLLMQLQADILGKTIIRPKDIESTARGAAYLAGLAVGFWSDWDELGPLNRMDASFTPDIDEATRNEAYDRWTKAVARIRTT